MIGGVFATLVLFVGTWLLGFPFPPEAIFQLLIAPVPGSIQSVVVETFLEYAKYTAFVFSAAIYALMYALIGTLLGFLFGRNLRSQRWVALVVGASIPSAIGIGLDSLLASNSSALASLSGWFISGLLILSVNLGYAALVVQRAESQLHAMMQQGQISPSAASSSRRGFLKKAAIAALLVAVAGLAVRVLPDLLSGRPVIRSDTPLPIDNSPTQPDLQNLPAVFRDPRISDLVGSEVTDNRIFYRVDIDPIPPQLNSDQWSLQVSGKVNNPLTFNKTSLMALPAKDVYATLECVSNTINPPGALISNAKWTGVPLAMLLSQAGASPDAKYVVFRCADGYTVGIPLERALKPEALLAYKMNGDILPNEHGFPLRAIVPGIYGMMNAKWITEIGVVDQVYLGYWQERGWSNDAKIKTTSIIYYPPPQASVNGALPIAGIAFAGDRGISKVEVSVDGGSTWDEAVLKPPHSPYSWVLWAYEWKPTSKDSYTIVARAYDGNGQVQDPTSQQPFPSGGSGYRFVEVTVT
jgi:DMSO/TMAO reductase YedYZ molybdopterin-dependent catalytic subunit